MMTISPEFFGYPIKTNGRYDCHWKDTASYDSITTAGTSAGSSITTCHVVSYAGLVKKDEKLHIFILLKNFPLLSCAYDVRAILFLRSESFLEHFNFEMREDSRFICRNRCRSYFPARYFAVDKDILLHLKVELL
ncbi:hypothetical protein QUW15_05255 [Desulfovibrio piger]|nr:hypothetical protein [Desulfovibrio piger]